MTYTLILFIPRKPSVSLETFKHHWETSHLPLLKELTGREFPLSHTRHYLEHSQLNAEIGGTQGVTYDAVATLTFINKIHYERFMGKLAEEGNEQRHSEDLEVFIDVKAVKAVLAGETKSTGRDGGRVGWRFVGSV